MLPLRSLPLGPPRASRSTVKDKQALYLPNFGESGNRYRCDDYVENAAVCLNVRCYLSIVQAL